MAVDQERVIYWAQFEQDVSALRNRLEASAPPGRYVLVCQSSYAFVVGLMALWQQGNTALLAPNLRPESLKECAAETVAILSDDPAVIGAWPIFSEKFVENKHGSVPWKILKKDQLLLELWTSGSSGERKRVSKYLHQIENELEILEKTFGAKLQDAQIFSTVSHQHIYGMLFRALWPLVAGRKFFAQTPLLWEDLLPKMQSAGHSALVSSPTHLQRLNELVSEGLKSAGCRTIFSSGGALQKNVASRIAQTVGDYPIEVFGSTETGGLAWRIQCDQAEDELWNPFEGVKISSIEISSAEQNLLQASSVWILENFLVLADQGQVYSDGRFRVLGRADRIVKVAEKRISLEEMEKRLLQHPWIKKAFVCVLSDRRQVLALLAVLNEQGNQILNRDGQKALSQIFRNFLGQFYDGVALPKLFRFYEEELPADALGKTTAALAKEIFSSTAPVSVTHPIFLSRNISENKLEYYCSVPENLVYLDGHFPGFALVPGVVQIQWVIHALSEWRGNALQIKMMESVKFKNVLLPGAKFYMTIEKKSGDDSVINFSLKNDSSLYSAGKLVVQ